MRRSPVRWLLLGGALVLLAAGVAVLRGDLPCETVRTQPACYVSIAPGPSVDTFDLVQVPRTGGTVPSGELVLTTIAVDDHLDVVQWIRALASETVDTVPREQFYPPGTDTDELRERNLAAMEDSQLSATIAALEAAGFTLEPDGARIVMLTPDAVTDELEPGDVVVAVDGEPVTASDELVAAVRARSPGQTLRLEVRRGQDTVELDVVAGESADSPGHAYLGILVTTEVELPVAVEIDAGVIGGPSAGLMFALAIVDRLEDTDLTGARVVAGTGTLDRDGRVGAVGGVRQKLVGATDRPDGADPAEVFLVPRGNLGEARTAPVGREILLVPVEDLDGALHALERLRAGELPPDAETLVPEP